MRRKLVLVVGLIIFLLLVPTSVLDFRPVSAVTGFGVSDPGNTWAPYGPRIKNLEYVYYSDPTSELNDFKAGHLDITDWPLDPGIQQNDCFNNEPDWTCSPRQGGFNVFGFYFNAGSSWFTKTSGGYNSAGSPHWGCDWNSGGQTYNTNCGREFRQGLAHLVNNRDFASCVRSCLPGGNVGLSDSLNPPASFPAGAPIGAAPMGFATSSAATGANTATLSVTGQTITAQCAWDQSVMVNSLTGCYGRPNNGQVETVNGNNPTAVGPARAIPTTGTDLGYWDSAGAYTISGSGVCSGPSGSLYQTCSAGNGFPQYGSPDFCAAAQHMINAGIAATIDAASCVITSLTSAASNLCASPLRIWLRSSQLRRALGQGFERELDGLFAGSNVGAQLGGVAPAAGACGSPVHAPNIFCNFECAGAIVFHELTGQGIDDWDIYTYGYTLPGPFGGSSLFPLLYGTGALAPNSGYVASNGGIVYPDDIVGSNPASSPCAEGTQGDEPADPTFVCNSQLDSLLKLQASTFNSTKYDSYTEAVYSLYGQLAIQIDVVTQGTVIEALKSVGGLVNVAGSAYNNGYTLLNARAGSYTPVNPAYTFGGGDPTTLRYGNSNPTSELNVFQAQSVWEFQLLNEIYDTLFNVDPVRPDQTYCWMCNTYQVTVDVGGNEHILVELRQDLRWQDGSGAVTASDAAFSLMALRDLNPFGVGLSLLGILSHVSVLSSTTLDVVFRGASILDQTAFSGGAGFSNVYVIPEHIWGCTGTMGSTNVGDDCFRGAQDVNFGNINFGNGAGLAESPDCTPQYPAPYAVNPWGPTCVAKVDYVSAGLRVPSDDRAQPTYDPVAAGTLVGSGPFMCKSLFSGSAVVIGGGCIVNSDGSESGQDTYACQITYFCFERPARAFLTAYDRTDEPGNSDPYLQYMRSYNPSWGTGTGTSAESGQFQEFSYADGPDRDGQVNIVDLAGVIHCLGVGPQGSAPCPMSTYNYWHRSAFDSGTISSTEVAIVAAHLDQTYPSQLQNVVPYS